jgi:hypothetical protein
VGAAEALARAAHEHALSIHAQLQAQQLTAAHLRDDAHYAQAAAHRASLLASTLAAWAVYSALGAASFSRLPPPPRRSGALPRLLALTALLALALEVVLVLRRGDGGLAPPLPLPPTTALLPPLPPGGAAAWGAAAAASSYDPDPAPAAPASPYFVSPRTQDLPALLLPVYYALAPRQGVLPLLQLQALVRTLRALYAAVTAAVLAWAWGGVVGAAAMREVLRRWGLRSGGGGGGGADGSGGSSSGGEQRGELREQRQPRSGAGLASARSAGAQGQRLPQAAQQQQGSRALAALGTRASAPSCARSCARLFLFNALGVCGCMTENKKKEWGSQGPRCRPSLPHSRPTLLGVPSRGGLAARFCVAVQCGCVWRLLR